ncbi:mitochondrial matrix Mmp37 [Aspergillus sclerotioniger CBS 115572]|uniref:Phosphatidate cytidylyltransferase, mitochondrial n=1 Tax=Aspergillus sclerotioniger CBS 115572 TaxID=1450535 RepID=A0A317WQB2_9EURO|nr:mitochondrial matrix Mmp37 [Aspergillus sclerotioniger CBS 115572]PWY87108.1 mitochondrial matrix Mmp37 [Aspergillus sclerotioniger CBS 115572]
MLRAIHNPLTSRPIIIPSLHPPPIPITPITHQKKPITTHSHPKYNPQSLKPTLQKILSHFPTPIDYAIAYGSNIFPQSQSQSPHTSNIPKMTDLIISVPSTQTFHTHNLSTNPTHYPPLISTLGPTLISKLNDTLGAGISYTPYITINNTSLKYGIINTPSLIHDLLHWESMYLAGRFHKPILVIKDHEGVEEARKRNLESAVKVALLILPGTFTERMFYGVVVGLSYSGDVRIVLGGEGRGKVDGIDMCPRVRAELVRGLPRGLRRSVYARFSGGDEDEDGMARRVVLDPRSKEIVERAVVETVRWPSLVQSLKSIVTAGVGRSWRYAMEKRRKARGGEI